MVVSCAVFFSIFWACLKCQRYSIVRMKSRCHHSEVQSRWWMIVWTPSVSTATLPKPQQCPLGPSPYPVPRNDFGRYQINTRSWPWALVATAKIKPLLAGTRTPCFIILHFYTTPRRVFQILCLPLSYSVTVLPHPWKGKTINWTNFLGWD